MNRKQLTLLVVLLAVLGVAGIFIQNRRNQGSEAGEVGAGQKLLGDKFPVNDITRIVIKGATNELNLVKKGDVWRVQERGDYPAAFGEISEFLIKAAGLKVIQSEEIGASQLGRMQLVNPGQGTNSGMLLQLLGQNDKTMATVLLGKKHSRKLPEEQMGRFGEEGIADGRYVMKENDKGHALLVGDPLNNIEPKPAGWLDKDFFRIEKPKTVSATFPETTNSWKLIHESETGEWKLADAKKDEKLDMGKASGATSPFGAPAFNDVLPPSARPEEHGLDKPTVVQVDTFDDLTYTIKVGKKAEDECPIEISVTANFPKPRTPARDEKPEDKDKADKAWAEQQKHLEEKLKHEQKFEKWVYLMPGWNVDSVIKVRKDFLEEKKDESKKDNKSAAAGEKTDDLTPPTDVLGTPGPDKKP